MNKNYTEQRRWRHTDQFTLKRPSLIHRPTPESKGWGMQSHVYRTVEITPEWLWSALVRACQPEISKLITASATAIP